MASFEMNFDINLNFINPSKNELLNKIDKSK